MMEYVVTALMRNEFNEAAGVLFVLLPYLK